MGQSGRVSNFTLIAFVLGFVINLALLVSFPPYRALLYVFGIEYIGPVRADHPSHGIILYLLTFSTIIGSTVLAGVGALLLYLSSRLDFVDSSHDPLKGDGLAAKAVDVCTGYYILSAIILTMLEILRRNFDEADDNANPFLMIPLALALLPNILVSPTYVFVSTSLFVGGLTTIPRSLRAYARQHRLSIAWGSGLVADRVDPEAVIGAIGDRTETGAEARKLHKDARQLLADVEAKVGELRRLRDELKRDVLYGEDVRKAESEADEILRNLSRMTGR